MIALSSITMVGCSESNAAPTDEEVMEMTRSATELVIIVENYCRSKLGLTKEECKASLEYTKDLIKVTRKNCRPEGSNQIDFYCTYPYYKQYVEEITALSEKRIKEINEAAGKRATRKGKIS